MRKTPIIISFAMVLCFMLTVVTNALAADTTMPDKIRITYVKLPLNVPAIIVKHLGLLEKEFETDGITIERPEITSGGKQTQALAAGSVDIASVLSSTSAITARANGVDLKVFSAFARAPRAFNIVSIDPDIKSIKDLKERKIAGPKGSLLNQTLYAALKKNSMEPKDVGYVHMGASKALTALLGGSVDAALIAGPLVPKATSQGARIIASGEGLVKGLIVTAVKESFLEEHTDLVKRYLAVQQQALIFMNDNPEETYKIVAKETGLDVDNVKNMYSWYDFTPLISVSDMQDLTTTQDFLVESGMLDKPTDIKAMVADISR